MDDAATVAGPETLAGTWKLDPAGSAVEFRGRHFWGLLTVRGTFTDLAGNGVVALDGTASGTLTLQSASLDTGGRFRDRVLRSDDFFAAGRFPTVEFRAQRIGPSPDGGVTVSGQLTVAGRTAALTFPAGVEATGDAVVLRADVVVDRALFGMARNPLGMAPTATPVSVVARFVRSAC